MSNLITVTGWLGADPVLRSTGEVPFATFRLASTPRRFNKERNEWEDGDTEWYSVKTFRALATNCVDSLRRGDPVLVHGRLAAKAFTVSGIDLTSFEIDARFVGHDLARGVSSFTRVTAAGQPGDQPVDRSGGQPAVPAVA